MLTYSNEAFEPQIVFSVSDAYTAKRLVTFAKRHDIPVVECFGQYNGEPRPYSFVAHAAIFAPLLFNGFLDGQESVLYLHPVTTSDGRRKAELAYLSGSALKLNARDYGYWQEVGKDVALRHEGWTATRGPDTRYFTCLDVPGSPACPVDLTPKEAAAVDVAA